MIIYQLTDFPVFEDVEDMIRFMVQSLDKSEESSINMLVKLWAYHIDKKYLTKRQHEVYMDIMYKFMESAKKQFPEAFALFIEHISPRPWKNSNGDTIQ